MRYVGSLWVAVSIAAAAPAPARAEMLPGFDGEELAWQASDVVVADRLDRERFRVVEVWAGGLAGGDVIGVAHVPRPTRAVTCLFPGCDETPIAGDRAILFLVRDGDAWRPAAAMYRRPPDRMQISVAWVHGERPLAFQQLVNPGHLVLAPLAVSTDQLRSVVDVATRARAELDAIEHLADPGSRVERLELLARNPRPRAAIAAVRALGRLGSRAVDALRELARDPARAHVHGVAVAALADAAGPDAAGELGALLAEETVFWRSRRELVRAVAKRAPDGWWNASVPDVFSDAERAELRDHYTRALDILWQLARVPDAAPDEVGAFCRLWRSLPPIGYDHVVDDRGPHREPSSQMNEACRDAGARR